MARQDPVPAAGRGGDDPRHRSGRGVVLDGTVVFGVPISKYRPAGRHRPVALAVRGHRNADEVGPGATGRAQRASVTEGGDGARFPGFAGCGRAKAWRLASSGRREAVAGRASWRQRPAAHRGGDELGSSRAWVCGNGGCNGGGCGSCRRGPTKAERRKGQSQHPEAPCTGPPAPSRACRRPRLVVIAVPSAPAMGGPGACEGRLTVSVMGATKTVTFSVLQHA